jgi:hypothetical protein
MERWTVAQSIERFLKDLEEQVVAIAAEQRESVEQRLRRARSFFKVPAASDYFLQWETADELLPQIR